MRNVEVVGDGEDREGLEEWKVSNNELWHILGEICYYWLSEDMQHRIRDQVSLKIARMQEGELVPIARPSFRLPPVLVWRVRGLHPDP